MAKDVASPARQALVDALLDVEFRAATEHVRPRGLVDSIRRRATAAGWPELAARAAVFEADCLAKEGKLVEAVGCLRELLEWAQAHDEADVLTDAHRALANVFRAIGDYPDALSHAVRSLSTLPDRAPWWRRVKVLTMLAITLDLTGSWPEAKARHAEAVPLAKPSPQLSLVVANNLAYGHHLHGEDYEAAEWGRRMLELCEDGRARLNAEDRETLAQIEIRRADYDSAEQYLAPVLAEQHLAPVRRPAGASGCGRRSRNTTGHPSPATCRSP